MSISKYIFIICIFIQQNAKGVDSFNVSNIHIKHTYMNTSTKLQKEIWKDIPNYEGMYQVSNLGRVKSLDREFVNSRGQLRKTKGILRKTQISIHGYERVDLRVKGTHKIVTVHLLVASAFLNHMPSRKMQVDHINNDKLDNRLENLQIITARKNSSKDRFGTSKYTGVSWRKRDNVWQSCINVNKKQIYLGNFKSEYEAHLAYQEKLKKIQNE